MTTAAATATNMRYTHPIRVASTCVHICSLCISVFGLTCLLNPFVSPMWWGHCRPAWPPMETVPPSVVSVVLLMPPDRCNHSFRVRPAHRAVEHLQHDDTAPQSLRAQSYDRPEGHPHQSGEISRIPHTTPSSSVVGPLPSSLAAKGNCATLGCIGTDWEAPTREYPSSVPQFPGAHLQVTSSVQMLLSRTAKGPRIVAKCKLGVAEQ